MLCYYRRKFNCFSKKKKNYSQYIIGLYLFFFVFIHPFFFIKNFYSYTPPEKNKKEVLGILNFFKQKKFKIKKNMFTGIIEITDKIHKISFTMGSRIIINNYGDLWILNSFLSEEEGDFKIPGPIILEIFKKYELHTKKNQKAMADFPKKKISFIVIDPGHGGKDPGNFNHNVKEKDINLAFSLNLVENLKKKYPHKKIYLIRKSDIWLNLENRTELAMKLTKKGEKGVYISIHCNASENPNAKGLETYFYQSEEQWEAKDTRIQKFKPLISNILNNNHLDKILLKMQDINISKESYILAYYLHHYLYDQIKNYTIDRGVKAHRYFVIRNINLPAILIELGFLSNKEEVKWIINKNYQNKLIVGFLKGLSEFINTYENNNGYIDIEKIVYSN